jgi:hypothetical protein
MSDSPLAQREAVPGDELFLFRALRAGVEGGSLPANINDTVMTGLSRIASHDMDALVLRESHASAREIALSGALHRASLGLEYGAEGDEERAVALLSDGVIPAAANTGAAILSRIGDQAAATEDALRMTSGLPTALSILDELYLANTVEDMFLKELSHGRMTAADTGPRLTETRPPRWIASLADVRAVSTLLGYFDARAILFQSFARDRLFAQAYPTDALGGCDTIVMARLFVGVVVSGDPTPRFHLGDEDLNAFPAGGFELAGLQQWVDDYATRALPHESQGPACEYMHACLAVGPSLLDHLT